jgi:hypothetical protein
MARPYLFDDADVVGDAARLARTDGDQHAIGEPRKTVTGARISCSACEQREIGCVVVAEDAAVTAAPAFTPGPIKTSAPCSAGPKTETAGLTDRGGQFAVPRAARHRAEHDRQLELVDDSHGRRTLTDAAAHRTRGLAG